MVFCTFRVKNILGPKVYSDVPDGGWGWVVGVAFFLVEVFTYGVIKSFGIFLNDLMNEFEETNSRVSWIISICVFVMTFTAPLSTVMSNRFGFQLVVMLGGFLISVGTISSAFTTSIYQMYITIGIVAGLGYCLTFLPTVTILSQYFSRRRSLVTSMASTGESFAIFAFAPAFTALKAHIGWRYTMMVIGTLQGTVIVCGALLRPIVIRQKETEQLATVEKEAKDTPSKAGFRCSGSSEDSGVQSIDDLELGPQADALQGEGVHSKTPPSDQAKETKEAKPKLLDLTVLKEGSFVCYSAFGLFATLAFFAPQLYVVELSASLGVEREKAAYMLSAMAISEIFGRLSVGWVMSGVRIRKIFILLGCVVLLCAVLVVFTLVQGFTGLVVCCVLYGFLLGSVASTHIPLLAEDDVVGIKRMPLAVGVYVCIQSFAGLGGPPLGGVLVDITKNYSAAFYSCAAGMGLGAIFLGLVHPAKSCHFCSTTAPQTQQNNLNNYLPGKDTPEEFLEVDIPENGQ
ncbi:solute carrier family 16 member 6a [Chanos chanos]|uniref:Monocarboxylate transporter 7 n=1 Tax=Chanos chanos TaxID=29144 RepID=A0A6J2V898_CHACN|nr:monocarboxylate transporter 7-like [Chanos chanos]